MSSVMDAVKTAWGEASELAALIPPARVFLGPPNPGSGNPCLGFTTVQTSGASHSSSTQYVTVTVTAVAEAADAETIETIAEEARQSLGGWQSTLYKSIRLIDVATTISRGDDTPKQLWVGELIFTFEAYRR